jgi:chemotaxis protein histidine kinase CheA
MAGPARDECFCAECSLPNPSLPKTNMREEDGRSRKSEFLIASYQNLNQLDHDLVELEKDLRSAKLLASVFRTFHTINGVSGFLNFGRLEGVAHAAEDMLSRLRDRELTLSEEITWALLASVDAVRRMLAAVAADGNDCDGDYSVLIAAPIRQQRRNRRRRSHLRRRSSASRRPPRNTRRTRARGRQRDPRQGQSARQTDEPVRRAGAGAQPDSAIFHQPSGIEVSRQLAASRICVPPSSPRNSARQKML